MPELLLILFKINLVLLLFAAAYHIVLRRLTFYTVNRAFLIIGIIFSTVYPFINLTEFFHRQEQVNPRVAALVPGIDVNTLIRNNAVIGYWQVVIVLFYIGVAFMAIRLIAQFVSLYRVHKRSKPGAVRDLNVRILEGKVSPFSFWQTVYVNPDIHSANELDTILAHEQIHVKEWHTLDIILAEISVVFYWFNPGVWLMKRAIKENIEFITDARIVNKGIDKKAYQYSLLGVGNLQTSVALVNNFNLSDLKKRIKMMNAKRSSPRKLIVYALILPVLLVATLAFTIDKKEVKARLMPLTEVNLSEQPLVEIANVAKPKVIIKRRSATLKSNISKADTSKGIKYIIKSVFIRGDSTKVLPELSDIMRLVKGTIEDADTIPGKNSVSIVEKIKMNLKYNLEGMNFKDVIVQGYSSKGSDFSKHNDTLKVMVGKVAYMLNGKLITTEEFKKMQISDIKPVSVHREDNLTLPSIVVISKKSQ